MRRVHTSDCRRHELDGARHCCKGCLAACLSTCCGPSGGKNISSASCQLILIFASGRFCEKGQKASSNMPGRDSPCAAIGSLLRGIRLLWAFLKSMQNETQRMDFSNPSRHKFYFRTFCVCLTEGMSTSPLVRALTAIETTYCRAILHLPMFRWHAVSSWCRLLVLALLAIWGSSRAFGLQLRRSSVRCQAKCCLWLRKFFTLWGTMVQPPLATQLYWGTY